MDYETAARLRDQIQTLKNSWIWQTLVLPEIERRCADLQALALEPGPGTPTQESARYRLDEWRKFQAWLESVAANAAEVARVADPSLGAGEEEEEGVQGLRD